MWVKFIKDGFNIPQEYRDVIERCEGKPLNIQSVENQNFLTCGCLVLGIAAYSGFIYKLLHPLPLSSDDGISTCTKLGAHLASISISLIPSLLFALPVLPFFETINSIVAMVFGCLVPCYLAYFAMFSGIRKKIYYAIVGAKEVQDMVILTSLGPVELVIPKSSKIML